MTRTHHGRSSGNLGGIYRATQNRRSKAIHSNYERLAKETPEANVDTLDFMEKSLGNLRNNNEDNEGIYDYGYDSDE